MPRLPHPLLADPTLPARLRELLPAGLRHAARELSVPPSILCRWLAVDGPLAELRALMPPRRKAA